MQHEPALVAEQQERMNAGLDVGLVCIDVDGTLLDSSGAAPPEVWRLASELRAAGVRLALCSGRPGFGIARTLARRLDADGWHSFQNGASVVHVASGRSRSTPLPAQVIALLVERARATGRTLELYTDDAYAFEVDSALARAHADLLGVPYQPGSFDELTGTIVRAQWLVSRAEALRVLAEPHPGLNVSPSVSPQIPDAEFINLTLAGVDKAGAVRTIAAEYGVTLDRVMYVGDARNDVPAMRIVGRAVAMGNAEPEAREAAHVTVAPVDEGGLAEALEMALGG